MAGVSDQDHLAAGGDVALALAVHLGDQRTGRIQHMETACGRIVLDAARDAVGTENGNRARRHLRKIVDKARTLRPQVVDDVPVVHDLVPDVHRRSEDLQRPLHDVDRANDARAEAARLRQNYPHDGGRCRRRHAPCSIIAGSIRGISPGNSSSVQSCLFAGLATSRAAFGDEPVRSDRITMTRAGLLRSRSRLREHDSQARREIQTNDGMRMGWRAACA